MPRKKPFRFKMPGTRGRRGLAPKKSGYAVFDPSKAAMSRGGFYQGSWVSSKEEWNVISALNVLKITHKYQISIGGGRRARGGFVIDFLLFVPFPVPLEIQSYWHQPGERKEADLLKKALMFSIYKREPVYLWDWQVATPEQAVSAIKSLVL